jgi:hypothetical protein
VTLNTGSVLRHVVRRTDAIALPTLSAPPAPTGTRTVTINNASQSAGDFNTLRNLTLNNNVGQYVVPPGTYGNVTVNRNSGVTLGELNTTEPSIYNLQNLTLNGGSQLQVVGPVIINLANGTSIFSDAGSALHPEWLRLNVYTGDVALGNNVTFNGHIIAPSGAITINGTVKGTTVSDRLTINGNGLLEQP